MAVDGNHNKQLGLFGQLQLTIYGVKE